MNNLCEENQQHIQYSESNHMYWFGDGKKVKATHSAKIPALNGNNYILIQADLIENEVPLLLSKSSMKKAEMTLDFQNDITNAFGEKIPFITTSSGHYAIPITKAKQIIMKQHSPATSQATLTVTDTESEKQLALKLHRQFAYPSKEKLFQLIINACPLSSNNKKLIKEVRDVSRSCPTCKIYRKPPPIPAVGLPMSNTFLETVAMDLKHYKGKSLLHIVDHCTRLFASAAIPN